MTSRRKRPSTRVSSASTCAGRRRRRRRSRGSPAARSSLQQQSAVGVRIRAHAPRAGRRQRRELRPQRAARVEQLLRADSSASTASSMREVLGIARADRRAAPGARGTCLRSAAPSTIAGPVQPFGVASTIIGQRGRDVLRRLARALSGCSRISATTRSSVVAISACIDRGIVALDEVRLPAVAAQQLLAAPRAGCAPAPSGWRSCSRSDAGSAAPRRRSPD